MKDIKTEKYTGMIEGFLDLARQKGLDQDYLFMTTLDRYMTQLSVLDSLNESLEEDEITITKEYVKGRENLYVNPIIQRINQTIDSANKTASLLLKLITSKKIEEEEEDLSFNEFAL